MPGRIVPFAATLLVVAALCADATADQKPVALLQALDKVTARISTLEAPLDRPVGFGTLRILARACFKAPPEEPPERAAFLEIDEVARDQPPRRLYNGWMFASSPGLAALEHPIYDIWVLDCIEAGVARDRPPSEKPAG